MSLRWGEVLEHWLEELRTRHRSPSTVEAAERWVVRFAGLCEAAGAEGPEALTPSHLVALQRHLLWMPGLRGRLYSPATVYQAQQTVRSFVRWLVGRGILLVDPSAEQRLPRPPDPVRRRLTVAEAEGLLAVPDPRTPLGQRDRAILEVLYGTALRRGECQRLDLRDVDLREGTLMVRRGKGSQDRVVPVGGALRGVLDAWLARGRPALAPHPAEPALFLNAFGTRISEQCLMVMVRERALQAGLAGVTAHTLRHACATHLQENGAHLRAIQELLGHRDVATTGRYTHVDVYDLAQEHRRTHPRAHRRPPPEGSEPSLLS